MSDRFLVTSLIDKQVFIDDKPKSPGELNHSKTVRMIYYGTSGLRAIVRDTKGNLRDILVEEMRDPIGPLNCLTEDSEGNIKSIEVEDNIKSIEVEGKDKPVPRPGMVLKEDLYPHKIDISKLQ